MNSNIKKGVNLGFFGLILTTVLYVLGFIWQYSYLGVITDHLGWIKIVTTDYIYLGVMSVVYIIPYDVFGSLALLFILIYSGLTRSIVKSLWIYLPYGIREKTWLYFNNFRGDTVEFYKSVKRFLIYLFILFFTVKTPIDIVDAARFQLAARLTLGPIDLLVENSGKKHKGKILYANNDQYYFYTFNGFSNYEKGELLIRNISDSKLHLNWNGGSKEKFDQVVKSINTNKIN